MNITLKEKLLATGYFKDNNYLDSYIQLVSTTNVNQSAFKTQSHHILPRTYFKTLNINIDNSADNLVELLFKDHVYAHWLLTKCTCKFLYRNSCYAVRYLLSSLNLTRYKRELSEADFEQLQILYETSILSINRNEFIDYYNNHLCRETAQHFSIGLNTVTRLAIEYECLKCKKRHLAKSRTIISYTDLANFYIRQNHSIIETANYFKVNKSTIIRLMNDYKLFKKTNCKHSQNRAAIKSLDRDEFTKYYLSHTAQETAQFFKLDNESQVRYICKKFGLITAKGDPKIVLRLDPLTGITIEYRGSYIAAEKLAIDINCDMALSSLSRAIRGACSNNKTYKGFIWKYKEE